MERLQLLIDRVAALYADHKDESKQVLIGAMVSFIETFGFNRLQATIIAVKAYEIASK